MRHSLASTLRRGNLPPGTRTTALTWSEVAFAGPGQKDSLSGARIGAYEPARLHRKARTPIVASLGVSVAFLICGSGMFVSLVVGNETLAITALGFGLAAVAAFLAEETDRDVARLSHRITELEVVVADLSANPVPAGPPSLAPWWKFCKR